MRRLPLWILMLALAGFLARSADGPADSPPFAYKTLTEWRDACLRLPSNKEMLSGVPASKQLPLKSFAEFNRVLDAFFDLCTTGEISRAESWAGTPPTKDFYNRARAYFDDASVPFQPFAQKVVIPAGSEVIIHADFHGDVRSLVNMLDSLSRSNYLADFKLAKPDTYLLFLGDYTDRGYYGTEVLYTLLRLRLENPDRVFLLRGNHEDISLAARYGFLAEGKAKYGAAFDGKKICRLYDFLPTALFLGSGTNFVQACHGGMEPGYSAASLLAAPGARRFQLLGKLEERKLLATQARKFSFFDPRSRAVAERYWQDFDPLAPAAPSPVGFMWNDFTQVLGEPQFSYDPGRAVVYGDRTTRVLLELNGDATNKVRAVLRAHQHASAPTPMMRRLIASQGMFRHWQPNDTLEVLDAPVEKLGQLLDRAGERALGESAVWTFNVGPDSVYGVGNKFDFDTFGILNVQPDYQAWRIKVINLPGRK